MSTSVREAISIVQDAFDTEDSREIHILATHFFRTPVSSSKTQPFAFASTSFFLRDKAEYRPVSPSEIYESFETKCFVPINIHTKFIHRKLLHTSLSPLQERLYEIFHLI